MPPKRQGNQRRAAVNEIYDRDDLDQRIGQVIDQRIGQVMDQRIGPALAHITKRLEALLVNQNKDFVESNDDSSSVDEYYDGEPIFDDYEEDEEDVFEVEGNDKPIFDEEPVVIFEAGDNDKPIYDEELGEEDDVLEADEKPIFDTYVEDKENEIFDLVDVGKPKFDFYVDDQEIVLGDDKVNLLVRNSYVTLGMVGEEICDSNTIFVSVDKEGSYIDFPCEHGRVRAVEESRSFMGKHLKNWGQKVVYCVNAKRILRNTIKIRGRILSNRGRMQARKQQAWIFSIAVFKMKMAYDFACLLNFYNFNF